MYLAVEDPVDAIRRHAAAPGGPPDAGGAGCAEVIRAAAGGRAEGAARARDGGVLDVAYRWTDKNKVELLSNVPAGAGEGLDEADRALPAAYAALLQHKDEWAERLDATQYLRCAAAGGTRACRAVVEEGSLLFFLSTNLKFCAS